jgi:dimethylhistidine N-methyltransferase
MEASSAFRSIMELDKLSQFYRCIRATSRALVAQLSDADATAQSMPDASPAKWHLAHSTWFFETMVLQAHLPGYRPYDGRYNFLFNSYYETIGARHPRSARGLLTRPSLETVKAYRDHVDAGLARLFALEPAPEVTALIELGCHHEQQHQELLLTDILHLFAQNPLRPAFKAPEPLVVNSHLQGPAEYLDLEGGLIDIGHDEGFAFDCEGPRHRVFLEPYRLADRLVTNREWIEFIEDGGYESPLLWLSEGWAAAREGSWKMPLYWELHEGVYWSMTLRGPQPLDLDAPVTHVSQYEAAAYAAWAGARLPTEAEWEHAAEKVARSGNFGDSGRLRPAPAPQTPGLRQMFGDVWEWTSSAFTAYPRFQITSGAVGEYNGKFMSGQLVLRGGSCVTPTGHIRASYRNFFPPRARWQFSGTRLAKDATISAKRPKTRSRHGSFRTEVLAGLSKSPKTIPSRWLYDERGSELFEEITKLEEYYPTRTETQILHSNAGDIARFCGSDLTVMEYGAGAGIKTEVLIAALDRPRFYIPVDIADKFLDQTATRFRCLFPQLATQPVVADFCADFALPAWIPLSNRMVFFPGSTIGNLHESEVCAFLRRARAHAGPSGKAVIGVDLRKPLEILIPAYDDAKGVTALFNQNLLARINRELEGNFVLEQFEHQVRWNDRESAVEMHLTSAISQTVYVVGREFHFSAGESIHTESSRKYDVPGFTLVCEHNGWHVDRIWQDEKHHFAVFGLI